MSSPMADKVRAALQAETPRDVVSTDDGVSYVDKLTDAAMSVFLDDPGVRDTAIQQHVAGDTDARAMLIDATREAIMRAHGEHGSYQACAEAAVDTVLDFLNPPQPEPSEP